MLSHKGLIGLNFLFCLSLWAQAGQKEPVYDCKNGAGEKLNIYLEDQGTRVVRIDRLGKTLGEWKLPSYLAFEDKPREPIRYLYVPSKNSFEIREQLFRESNPQELRLMLIQEGEVLTGWQCFYHGAQLKIRMLENLSDSSKADLLFVTRAVKGFVTEEKVSDGSLGMLVPLIERYALWAKKSDKTEIKRLVIPVFQPVVYLSPAMVKQVNARLSAEARATWDLVLAEENYESFAPVQRWIFWVNLGSRNNNEAVRAGIRGFVKSPLFQDKNMQKFFQTETRTTIQGMSSEILNQIAGSGLSETETNFLQKMWKERNR
jgi:hypothetical protein